MKPQLIDNPDQNFWLAGLTLAPKTRRFANFLVDYIICSFLAAFVEVGMILSNDADTFNDSGGGLLIHLSVLFLYYLFFEYFLNGKTVGKYLTRTRVVSQNGGLISFRAILVRSIYRLTLPLDILTFIGGYRRGGHDIVSGTSVVMDPALEHV